MLYCVGYVSVEALQRTSLSSHFHLSSRFILSRITSRFLFQKSLSWAVRSSILKKNLFIFPMKQLYVQGKANLFYDFFFLHASYWKINTFPFLFFWKSDASFTTQWLFSETRAGENFCNVQSLCKHAHQISKRI